HVERHARFPLEGSSLSPRPARASLAAHPRVSRPAERAPARPANRPHGHLSGFDQRVLLIAAIVVSCLFFAMFECVLNDSFMLFAESCRRNISCCWLCAAIIWSPAFCVLFAVAPSAWFATASMALPDSKPPWPPPPPPEGIALRRLSTAAPA